ncbi:MAG: TolB family protein, partial [Janthinobacterium lividum]
GDLEQVALDGVPPLNNDHVMDGDRGLVYVSANDGHIWVAPLEGGSGRRVTHDDTRFHFLHGVSPDGTALAFVELPVGDFSAPGRLALVPADRGATRYPRAGFPHLSPDGTYATYISFPPGTLGHPPDLPVEVRLVRTADWRTPVATFPVPGGQGTLNVNSWAPDSRRFAFVSYPIDGDCGP